MSSWRLFCLFFSGLVSEYWLVVEYHPNKTLCEYLKQRTVDLHTLADMALSLADGLAHLHMEQTHDGVFHRSSSLQSSSLQSSSLVEIVFSVIVLTHYSRNW